MPAVRDIVELYVLELRTALAAERAICEVLERLVADASDAQLRAGLRRHRAETEEHVKNLETALRVVGSEPSPGASPGTAGLREEHDRSMSDLAADAPALLRDLVISGSGAHLELYEIGTYEALVAKARLLGHDEVAELLEENLEDERAMLEEGASIAERLVQELVVASSRR